MSNQESKFLEIVDLKKGFVIERNTSGVSKVISYRF